MTQETPTHLTGSSNSISKLLVLTLSKQEEKAIDKIIPAIAD